MEQLIYSVRLGKIKSTHNNIGDGFSGWCFELPISGEPYLIYSESHDPNSHLRFIRTSLVQSVVRLLGDSESGHIQFKTKNSTYELFYKVKPRNLTS